MKKLLVLTLALMLTLTSTALAADVSQYESHASIDLTPFKGSNYTGAFDDFAYTAELYPENCAIKYDESTSYWKKNATLDFDIKMVYSADVMTFLPRMKLNAENSYKYSFSDLYIKVGQNRYHYEFSTSSYYSSYSEIYTESIVLPLGPEAIKPLREIVETDLPVSIKLQGSGGSFNLPMTSQTRTALAAFIGDCEKAGIFNQVSWALFDSNCTQITDFNP